MLKPLVKHLLHFGVSAACLWLAVRGADVESIKAALATVSPWAVSVALAYVLFSYIPAVLRLRMISATGHSPGVFLRAIVLGAGLNNILPARIGEFAKMFYLTRNAGMPFSRGMEVVFWERFSDLNALLALALFGALTSDKTLALQALAAGVVAVWAALGIYLLRPGIWDKLLRMLPGKRLWGAALSILGHLRERFSPGFLLRLALSTAPVLGMSFGLTALVLVWIGGLALTPAQLVAVFLISQLGLAVPSSPGAIGVYEASVVLPLAGFGVDRGTALALAVVLHATQYLPPTLGCVYLLARGELSLRELRARTSEPQD